MAGDFVNLYDNAGTLNARKADANNNRQAHGFVLTSTTSPASTTVNFTAINTLSGLTVGATYYLSETAGLATSTQPTASGSLVQRLGIASSATELIVDIDLIPLELA